MDDVRRGSTDFPSQPVREHRVEIPRRPEADVGDPQPVEPRVERIGVAIVEADERCLDVTCAEGGQQGEQVPLGASDATKAVNVNDSQDVDSFPARAPRAAWARASVIAAGTQSRKSHGAR